MRTLYLATLVVWGLLEVRQSLMQRTGAQSQDRGSLTVARVAGVTGVLLAAFAGRLGIGSYPVTPGLSAVALIVMWAGIALRQWCFITLGHYFTFTVMTSPDQRVVTGGPYSVLRHPSYTAILLIVAGIGLAYGNLLSFAALIVIPGAGILYRIHVEEAALARTLGAAYTDFARSRKRLIPFVW